MRKKIFCLFLQATFLISGVSLFCENTCAKDDPIVAVCRIQPKANRNSDFAKRLAELPEWETFVTAFTGACDQALGKELTLERLEKRLPPSAAAQVNDFIKKGLSTRKGYEIFAAHVDAVLFELEADFDHKHGDENLKDMLDFLRGPKKDLELDFDGFLAFVMDVNPRDFLSFLENFRKDKDYRFLKNEPEGDFILEFDFEYRGREIEACCTGLKLSGENRYVLIFSNEDDIRRYCEAFQTGRYADLDYSKPLTQIGLEESFFLFLDRQQRRLGADSIGTGFLSKIKRATLTFHDVDGVSVLEISGEMTNRDEAKSMNDILTGFIALGQLQFENDATAKELLRSIRTDATDNKVSVQLKLDHGVVWKLLGKGLKIAADEINRRAGRSM